MSSFAPHPRSRRSTRRSNGFGLKMKDDDESYQRRTPNLPPHPIPVPFVSKVSLKPAHPDFREHGQLQPSTEDRLEDRNNTQVRCDYHQPVTSTAARWSASSDELRACKSLVARSLREGEERKRDEDEERAGVYPGVDMKPASSTTVQPTYLPNTSEFVAHGLCHLDGPITTFGIKVDIQRPAWDHIATQTAFFIPRGPLDTVSRCTRMHSGVPQLIPALGGYSPFVGRRRKIEGTTELGMKEDEGKLTIIGAEREYILSVFSSSLSCFGCLVLDPTHWLDVNITNVIHPIHFPGVVAVPEPTLGSD
ncbi:hypothetical protein ONZ45_g11481 [Pleurotus djamor]|nr:hypothetical protein ONZ45_g11481 [Pleurotus djamor]